MSRSLPALLLAAALVVAAIVTRGLTGYAQTTGPSSDEFNDNSFVAPFAAKCGQFAATPCPDAQGANTWSLNGEKPGFLRIMTQFGSLVGTSAQSSNNARNFVVQPAGNTTYTATTSMTFPGNPGNVTVLGQTGGIIVYQDDDHFIYLGRKLTATGPMIEFLQENGGSDLATDVPEPTTPFFNPTIYFRIVRTGTLYEGFYSYTNGQGDFHQVPPMQAPLSTATPTSSPTPTSAATATPTSTPVTPSPTPTNTPVPTSTPLPTGYVADYSSPQIGDFAWGGLNSAVSTAVLPADFDWFRVGENSLTPGPSPTATNTAVATNTPVVTNTPVATNTPVPATNTPTPAPTNTPLPTATPAPTSRPSVPIAAFSYVSVWYHAIHQGDLEHLQAQAKHHSQHGIWVIVHFATGKTISYYTNTDKHGFWQASFRVPGGTISSYSSEAVVTFQLWKGKSTAKDFDTFFVLH